MSILYFLSDLFPVSAQLLALAVMVDLIVVLACIDWLEKKVKRNARY